MRRHVLAVATGALLALAAPAVVAAPGKSVV